jgi:phosphatidylglycerol:prolipoprotein diacylglycerol transferase
MHPIICAIGPITIYSYGLLIALGSLVFLIGSLKEGRKQGIPSGLFYDLYFFSLISGLIGARLLYVLTNLDFFRNNFSEVFKIYHGGLSWFGAFMFGIIAAFLVTKKYRVSFLRTVDICAPYLALAQGLGRLGCLLNGCCFGKESHAFFALNLSGHSQSIHPTQLYSFFGLILIFIFLENFKKKEVANGQVFSIYLGLYGIKRFIIEFFRGDTISTPILNLTLFQIFSLIWILTAVILYTSLAKKHAGKNA